MNSSSERFRWAYSILVGIGHSLQSLFLLAVRLYWGWQICQTGWGKMHGLPGVVQFFASPASPRRPKRVLRWAAGSSRRYWQAI